MAILSEVWSNISEESTNKYKISGYHTILKSRYDGYGGAGILLANQYNFVPIDLPKLSDNTQAICVKILPTEVMFLSVYISPSITTGGYKEDTSKLFSFAAQYQKVIMGGDFNAHHQAWGDDKCDGKGEILIDQINSSNMLICNDGSPTFIPLDLNKRATALDITLASTDLFTSITWGLTDYCIGSHHLAINISLTSEREIKPAYYINRKQVQKDIATLTGTEIRSIADLRTSVKQIFKKNRFKNTKTPKFWWSAEVDEAWTAKTEARRMFNRVSGQENLIEFKKKAAIFQRLKRLEKQKKFDEFPEEVGPFTSSKELWTKIGRLTGRKIRRKENMTAFDDTAAAEVFLDTHFGKSETVTVQFTTKIVDYPLLTLDKWNSIPNQLRRTS